MSDKHLPAESETVRQKPGQLLRQAREKLGLEQKNVANQLNLQTDIIAALEEDDTTRLPVPTYVRGYIRSYARIVHLDGNMLINLYNDEAVAPPEIIPDIKKHTQINSHDKPVKAFTYLVTFALALLLIAWLLQGHYAGDTPATNLQNEIPDTPASDQQPSPDWPDNGGDNVPASTLAAFPETETTPLSGISVDEHVPTLDTSGLISNIGLPETSTTIGTSATETIETTSPAGYTGISTRDQINLKVRKESWVEIYDAGNNRLYLGLARSGEEIAVSGAAPFNVLLGYSPGVQISYNGNSFDPSPYSTGGVAKFTLGPGAEAEQERSE